MIKEHDPGFLCNKICANLKGWTRLLHETEASLIKQIIQH
jgi:hypothetical protein